MQNSKKKSSNQFNAHMQFRRFQPAKSVNYSPTISHDFINKTFDRINNGAGAGWEVKVHITQEYLVHHGQKQRR